MVVEPSFVCKLGAETLRAPDKLLKDWLEGFREEVLAPTFASEGTLILTGWDYTVSATEGV